MAATDLTTRTRTLFEMYTKQENSESALSRWDRIAGLQDDITSVTIPTLTTRLLSDYGYKPEDEFLIRRNENGSIDVFLKDYPLARTEEKYAYIRLNDQQELERFKGVYDKKNFQDFVSWTRPKVIGYAAAIVGGLAAAIAGGIWSITNPGELGTSSEAIQKGMTYLGGVDVVGVSVLAVVENIVVQGHKKRKVQLKEFNEIFSGKVIYGVGDDHVPTALRATLKPYK